MVRCRKCLLSCGKAGGKMVNVRCYFSGTVNSKIRRNLWCDQAVEFDFRYSQEIMPILYFHYMPIRISFVLFYVLFYNLFFLLMVCQGSYRITQPTHISHSFCAWTSLQLIGSGKDGLPPSKRSEGRMENYIGDNW